MRRTPGACIVLGAAALAAAATAPDRDPLLFALETELARSVGSLEMEGLERPYFIEYGASDLETFDGSASLGALLESRVSRLRPLRVDVRVGDYTLDSSEFMGRQSFIPWATASLALDGDVTALRHDAWLATDNAYKRALEQMAQKRAALENRVRTEPVPDLARQESQRYLGHVPATGFETSRWEGLLRSLSAILREFPDIEESRVTLRAVRGSRYVVNSEGTAVREPWAVTSLVASGSTQAPDGMRLWNYAPFLVRDPAQLPDEATLAAGVRRMAAELRDLAAAPVLESYIGPVLFTDSAAPEVFAQLLAPELSGQRLPLFEDPRTAARLPQQRLSERLGRRVLPSFLSVVDDPRPLEIAGVPLVGSYRFDEQGVPGEPVTLVERGLLKSFVMSRRPRKEIARSNGHGRATALSAPTAAVSNLFVEASEGKDLEALKHELIASCRLQGMEFGLLIARLDLPVLSGRDEPPRGRVGQDTITHPVLAYRVSVADGSMELVRGLAVGEMSVRTLREIVAAGSARTVWNRPFPGRGYGLANLGPIATESLPVTIVAPAVLFDEIELKRQESSDEKPMLLDPPMREPARRGMLEPGRRSGS